MNYEKNIPTKQNQKKAFPWVPCTNGNSRRTSCDSTQKTEGQTPVNGINIPLKFPFLKGMHVRKKWEFGKIRKLGKKFYGKHVCFQYIFDPKHSSKLGLTVSRKYGGAVKRNFFKRRMREIFRTLCPNLPTPITINILPLRGGKSATFEELRTDWKNFIIYIQKGLEDEKQAKCPAVESLHHD